MDGFQDSDGSCRLPFQSKTDMIGMSWGSILKVDLSFNARPGEVLQILQLIDAGIPVKAKVKVSNDAIPTQFVEGNLILEMNKTFVILWRRVGTIFSS